MFQFNYDLHRLSGLPCLKYLRLDYHHDSLLPAFFIALAQNFPSITDLEFTSMHFDSFNQFVQIVESLPLLRRVALAQVQWYDNSPDSDDSESEDNSLIPVYMASNFVDVVADCGMDSHCMDPVLLWLPSQLNIRRLAIGRLNHGAHTAPFSDVLRALGLRLEHLIIHDVDGAHSPDLSHAIALHTFEITGILCLPASTGADFEWVPTLLSQLPLRALQCIVLVIDLRLGSLRRVEVSVSGHKNWAIKAIAEHLKPRAFALRVRQWEGRPRYPLDAFGRSC
ncbi:hypothetical protein B0H19DRAFT_1367723 [Mycena capillaripes]|nr:hypothetical protein B0H19DRAFT_1367723 [Mycena capillaripes]